MQKIALITDSCADLTFDTLDKNNITMFPIRLIYKDREYLDKIEISSEQMYASLSKEIPSTSLPDLGYCEKQLETLKAEGFTHFIIITVSSNLSGTFNALQLLSEHHPELTFHFFDSRTLGYPQGVIATAAAELVAQNYDFNTIVNKLEDIRKRTHGYIAIETLEYLEKGGRIGKVAATLGTLLHLRPIISSNDHGELYSYTKARGKKQVYSKLRNILDEYLKKGKCRVWVLQGDALEEGQAFMESIKDLPNITHLSLESVGPSMGVHAGPGIVGIAILEEA